jgi:cytochrome c-type biogenesis protein CcmH
MQRFIALAALVATLSTGCDRNVEAYDPDEEPSRPDLGRIFPEGAERAARAQPELPPAPGGRGAPPMGATAAQGQAPAPGPPISGTIRLAPDLGAPVPPGAVLFIVARTGTGGPPTAVKRIGAPRFPLDFELGPDDRMIQAMPFNGPFQLTARVDSDGDAASRTPGDLQGGVESPVSAGATGVELVLDEVL